MLNHWLMLNDRAGLAANRLTWLHEQARRYGLTVRTVDRGSTGSIVAEALDQGVKRLIVAGGDGTVAHCVQALAPNFGSLELGVVPLGTGNDFARSLGLPTENVASCLNTAVEAPTAPIDLLEVRDQDVTYCLNAATGGAGGGITANMTAQEKQRWGAFAYWLRAIAQFVDLQPHQLTLESDGKIVFADQAYGIIITNGRFVGGGFPIAPMARMDDGRFDITIIPVLPRLELISAGLYYAMGQKGMAQQIVTLTATNLKVHTEPEMMYSLDGEPSVHLDACFHTLPQVLRIARPVP